MTAWPFAVLRDIIVFLARGMPLRQLWEENVTDFGEVYGWWIATWRNPVESDSGS